MAPLESVYLPHNLVCPSDRRYLVRDIATISQLEAVNVHPKWQHWIRQIDTDIDEGLVLLHYITTVHPDTGKINEEPMNEIGHVRGIILEKTTKRGTEGEIKWRSVCKSFPYTPEVVTTDTERVQRYVPEEITGPMFKANEGSIIRMYNHNGRWIISTHRKIDAQSSFWSGPTFGEMFSDVFNLTEEDLDPRLCYIYILQHTSHRIVYPIENNALFEIAQYCAELDNLVFTQQGQTGITNREMAILTVDAMAEHQNPEMAGAIVFNNSRPVKLVNENYSYLKAIRGNDARLRSRYLQLRGTPEMQVFVNYFPEGSMEYKQVENEILDLAKYIHQLYIIRFINKNKQRVDKEEFCVIMKCHSWYFENPGVNIVRLEKVLEVLNQTPTKYLNVMLRRQKK